MKFYINGNEVFIGELKIKETNMLIKLTSNFDLSLDYSFVNKLSVPLIQQSEFIFDGSYYQIDRISDNNCETKINLTKKNDYILVLKERISDTMTVEISTNSLEEMGLYAEVRKQIDSFEMVYASYDRIIISDTSRGFEDVIYLQTHDNLITEISDVIDEVLIETDFLENGITDDLLYPDYSAVCRYSNFSNYEYISFLLAPYFNRVSGSVKNFEFTKEEAIKLSTLIKTFCQQKVDLYNKKYQK